MKRAATNRAPQIVLVLIALIVVAFTVLLVTNTLQVGAGTGGATAWHYHHAARLAAAAPATFAVPTTEGTVLMSGDIAGTRESPGPICPGNVSNAHYDETAGESV
jgi:phosphoribosylformylglycinamidine (FGAM) synthase-like enzyme